MKIYVSGSWLSRDRLRLEANKLRADGHEIISTWLDEQDRPEHLTTDQWLRRIAAKDGAEVAAADAIVMDVREASTTGGRYVEWGIACHPHAMILRVLVGEPKPEDVFGQLADARFPDWAALHASGVLGAA